MGISTFGTAAAFTQRMEGGYSGSQFDPGNWTSGLINRGQLVGSNMGISAPVAIAWLGAEGPKTVTSEWMQKDVSTIWEPLTRVRYWNAVQADYLPTGVDLMVFDHGFNRGAEASARVLQRVMGVTVDGWVGSETLLAIAKVPASALLVLLYKEQCKDYISLGNPVYQKGWLARSQSRFTAAVALLSAPTAAPLSSSDEADILDEQYNQGA